MKILIVGLNKIKYMPYLNFYLDALKDQQQEIHVCYWDRDGKDEDLTSYKNIQFHRFVYAQTNGVNKLKKIKPFSKFKMFVKKINNETKFDLIIALHSLTAILIYGVLRKKNYILDYRDSTFEKNAFFRRKIKKIVLKSRLTFTSSEGFKKYLPKSEKIYNSHNLLLDSLEHRDFKKTESDKIRLSFWGYIRHVELNKVIIDKIKNDDRFELHYYGREQESAIELKKYSKSIEANNVFFHGEYNPSDRYEFIKNTDLIHNIYCDSNMMLAMGNKFYDGIIFRIPQLCYTDSTMGKQCSKYGVGLECNPNDENFLNKIYDYYKTLSMKEFNNECDIALDYVLKEYNDGIKRIRDLLHSLDAL